MKTFLLASAMVAMSVAVAPAAESATISEAKVVRDGNTAMVTWSAVGGVDVLWSTSPNAAVNDMELLTEADGDGIFAVTDLSADQRYYFYLRHRDGSGVRTAARLLPLEGGRNFRDMGGYTTADGRSVKWGHVFRSGVMHELTPADYDYLSSVGIQVVCDYRANDERSHEPTKWGAGTIEYVTRDYVSEDSSAALREAFQDPDITPEKMAMGMAATYYDILEDQKETYSTMFHHLASGDVPLAFNCSAGKDRAGTSAALVLLALGVDRDQVIQDYSLSELYVDYEAAFLEPMSQEELEDQPYAFLAEMPREMIRPLLRSAPAYIENTLNYLDNTYGGVEGYLEEELGIDAQELAAIRANLLE